MSWRSRKRLYSFHKKTSEDFILSSEGQVKKPAGPILSQVSILAMADYGGDKAKSLLSMFILCI